MRTVSAALAAAIVAVERTARARLKVDWDDDGFGADGSIDDLTGKVAAASMSRTLQTDVPAEVQLVEGSAVASLSADLVVGDSTDERQSAVRYWSRFNPASPLYGKERMNRDVTLSVEFLTATGWQSVPRMVGSTRSLPVDVGEQVARLGVLDSRQRLRSRLSLPAVIAEAPPTSTFPTDHIQAPGLESTWVASYVCAQNGIYVSPPPRAGCRAWLPMHGSLFPFIADMVIGVGEADYTDGGGTQHRAARFQTGPYLLGTETVGVGGRLFVDLTTTRNDPAHRIVNADGTYKLRIEFWAKAAAFAGSPPIEVQITNSAHGGDITSLDFHLSTSSTAWKFDMTSSANGAITTVAGPAPVLDGNWHFYGLFVDSGAGSAVFRVDNTSTTVGFAPVAPVPWSVTDEAYDVLVWAYEGNALAELQITGGGTSSDPWLNGIAWTPGAVIDRGYPLQGIADTSPQDSWQILTDLQGAVLGAAWFDEDGLLQVAMPGRLVGTAAQTVQRTLTSLTDIVDLAYDDQATSVRNRVIVPYQPVVVHVAETMWSAPGTVYLPPGGTITLYAEFAGPFVSAPSLVFSANTAPDGTGIDAQSFIRVLNTSGTVRGTFPTAQTGIYTLINGSPVAVWLVDNTGSPKADAVGDWVEQTSGALSPEAADILAGQQEQALEVPANRWRQDRSLAWGLAMGLLCDLRGGRQILSRLTVQLDPRLQFYDLVTVEDQHGTGLNNRWWITGVSEDYQAMRADLTARQAQARFLAGTGLVGIDIVG